MTGIRQRDYLLVFLFLFVVFIGFSEFSGEEKDLVVGQAQTDVEECGCSKCHSIELTRCGGCHGTQPGKERSDDSAPGPEENPESPPDEPNNEPKGSPPEPDEPPGSEPDKPGDDREEPETTPNKYQKQRGLR